MSGRDRLLPRERVRTELREVAALLSAVEQIADGLAELLEHAYDHDHRTSEALAAARRLVVVLREEHNAAEQRVDESRGPRHDCP